MVVYYFKTELYNIIFVGKRTYDETQLRYDFRMKKEQNQNIHNLI